MQGYSLSLWTCGLKQPKLVVRVYSLCYTETSGVAVLTKGYRLAINGVNSKFSACISSEMLFLKVRAY